jgi:ATP-binding cassette subfamily F protein uup
MISQRGGDLGAKKVEGKLSKKELAAETKERKAKQASSAKMTFKDKHALETLPTRMAELQKEIDTHQATLADPDLFRSDPAKFDKVAKAMQDAESALAASEEQWLELEMKREEAESG